MSLTLSEARCIAADVVANEDPTIEVLGVTRAEGGSQYTEVILTIRGCTTEPCRIMIGLNRDTPEPIFRQEVQRQVRHHLSEHRKNLGRPQ